MLAVAGAMLVMMLALALVLARSMRDVPSGKALVVQSASGPPAVRFHRTIVIPLLQTAELLDISTRRVIVERRGAARLRCRDRGRVALRAEFLIHVNPTQEDVLAVRSRVSADNLANPTFIQELFESRFVSGLETVAAQVDAASFEHERETIKDEILQLIGADLDGFVLDDVSLTGIEVSSASEQIG